MIHAKRASNPLPLIKLVGEVLLEPGKLVPESLATPPTNEIPFQISLPAGVSPHILLGEGKILQGHEEGRREAVVMLSMLEAGAQHVSGDDVQMEMIHRRMSVDADHDLGRPISTWWQSIGWRISVHGDETGSVLSRNGAVQTAQLLSCKPFELDHLLSDFSQKCGVGK